MVEEGALAPVTRPDEVSSGADPDGPAFRVDVDVLHRPQIEEESVVDGRIAGHRVAACPDCEWHPGGLDEEDRRDYVAIAGSPGDGGGAKAGS